LLKIWDILGHWEITGVRKYAVRCSKFTNSVQSSGCNRDF